MKKRLGFLAIAASITLAGCQGEEESQITTPPPTEETVVEEETKEPVRWQQNQKVHLPS
ncbi:hypothetical protein ACFO0S_00380 [Chryseomicrobium palamuruense]|uniref:Uncharacterized protein n=1 Tax=Chryseomicrobium palamuruense TaxID=682973 RepID=A0ABV8URY3_9BACL